MKFSVANQQTKTAETSPQLNVDDSQEPPKNRIQQQATTTTDNIVIAGIGPLLETSEECYKREYLTHSAVVKFQ